MQHYMNFPNDIYSVAKNISIERFREIRDLIKDKVEKLFKDLDNV